MPIPDASSSPGSTWGKIRDALAAVHNLETLLKSPRVGAGVLAALLPEVRVSSAHLRSAFTGSAAPGARGALAAFASDLLDALERALGAAEQTEIEARARLALEQAVMRVSGELGAAVDLLDLIERAEAPAPTELSLEELAGASLGLASSFAPGEEVKVRLDTQDAQCVVVTDARVLARLVALAVARVRTAPEAEATVRTHCAPHAVEITIGPSDATSTALPAVAARLPRLIPPSDAIVEAAARAIGGSVTLGEVVVLTLPRA
jgi:hypothetical protein